MPSSLTLADVFLTSAGAEAVNARFVVDRVAFPGDKVVELCELGELTYINVEARLATIRRRGSSIELATDRVLIRTPTDTIGATSVAAFLQAHTFEAEGRIVQVYSICPQSNYAVVGGVDGEFATTLAGVSLIDVSTN